MLTLFHNITLEDNNVLANWDQMFFFHFGRAEGPGYVELRERGRLELDLGPKTCGVVHLHQGELQSALIKGVNEVEGVTTEVAARWGEREVRGRGDVLWFRE